MHRLPVDAWMAERGRLPAGPVPVQRMPRSVEEVLREASARMDAEDAAGRREPDYERAHWDWLRGRAVKLRRPRKMLRRWLSG